MAGLYPDVPGPRIAWHRDGSVCLIGVGEQTGGTRNTMNSEYGTIAPGSLQTITVAFPEKHDIVGANYRQGGATNNCTVDTSVDTTNGIDGTWVNRTTTFQMSTYRTIQAVSYLGVKGIRFRAASVGGDTTVYGPHLYGAVTAGEVRWLVFTDTGGTELTGAAFDFADDPRGGATEDKTFKIRNDHPTLTANTVGLSVSVLSDKSPSFADDYTFSDGGAFASTLALGTLAPGVSTGTLTVRRTTPVGAALGLETGMFLAIATSWS